MRLILIRHGETIENNEGIIQGHLHGKLSDLGIEQAKKVALRLKEENIDCLFSSDLTRAVDTAKEILKFHSQIRLELVEELRERNLGDFQGKPHPEGWEKVKDDEFAVKEKGGESPKEILKRAKSFFENIFEKFKGKTIVFVAHNGINQAIITALLKKEWQNMKELERQKNTAVNIFEFDENGNLTSQIINCTKHL